MDNWEPKRIERPPGVPEWGVPPTNSSGNALQNEPLSSGQQDTIGNIGSSKVGQPKIILGPDGKPCRACNSKLAFSAAMRGSKKNKDSNENSSSSIALPSAGGGGAISLDAAAAASSSSSSSSSQQMSSECPPDGEIIGNNTWTFLHSVAAYYPSTPSPIQQTSMISLIQALPNLYPCHSCAEALQDELNREKQLAKSWEGGKVLQEAAKSGPGLRKWLCGLHNEVNARLGKPTWKCEESILQSKWLTGPEDGRCDDA